MVLCPVQAKLVLHKSFVVLNLSNWYGLAFPYPHRNSLAARVPLLTV